MELRFIYVNHALVVRSRSNAIGCASPTVVRTTSVRTLEALGGDGGAAAAELLDGVPSEGKSRMGPLLDVRSSSACGEVEEAVVATAREVSLGGFEGSSSLSEAKAVLMVGPPTSWCVIRCPRYNVATAVCNSLSNLRTLSRPDAGIMPPRAAA